MVAISARQIALVHVARRALALSEDEYRGILSSRGGVESARDLDPDGLDRVMAHFRKLGFRPRVGHSPRPPDGRPATSRELLRAKIRAQLRDLGLTESYADAISRSRFGVHSWTWLGGEEMWKLAAMLAYHQRRHPERRRG